jgi:ribulose-phosphate 3-epimerase
MRRDDQFKLQSADMISDPFKQTSPVIAPSILAANFGILSSEINEVMGGGGDIVHLDIMDGHFVPNISFGPPVAKSLRMATKAYLDAHLMITDPLKYGTVLVKECGVQNITFHIEVCPGKEAVAVAKAFRSMGVHVGITLNPPTAVETIWPVLEEVDMVLVMSVMPGFGGQKFTASVLDKVEAIKRRMRPGQRIEIDGGIEPHTIGEAYEAGADWFVVGSWLFGKLDRARAIQDLRAAMAKVGRRPELEAR